MKFLTRWGDKALARFVREAQIMGQLHHPNVLGIVEANHQDGHPYLVMEYLEGGSLKDRLHGKPAASPGAPAVGSTARSRR